MNRSDLDKLTGAERLRRVVKWCDYQRESFNDRFTAAELVRMWEYMATHDVDEFADSWDNVTIRKALGVKELYHSYLDNPALRRVELPHSDGTYVLETWDANGRASTGQHLIRYQLTDPSGKVLFRGSDYGCAPSHATDSDAALRGILSFLTLKPGDTDADYFEHYTPEQLAFAEGPAESLAMYCEHPDDSGDSSSCGWDFDAEAWYPLHDRAHYAEEYDEKHADQIFDLTLVGYEHGVKGYYPDGDYSSDADWCYGTGDAINKLETELGIDDGEIMNLYTEAHAKGLNR